MSRTEPSSRRLILLVLTGAVVVAAAWFTRPWLRQAIGRHRALNAPWVDRDEALQLIQEARQPAALIQELWQTGRITHRRAAFEAAALPRIREAIPEALQTKLLDEAATDPDMSLREAALGGLRDLAAPARLAMVTRQLTDVDPELRRLGLDHLGRLGGLRQVPWVLPLLADPEPRIALLADAVLRRWSGTDQGLRLSLAPVQPSLLVTPEPSAELLGKIRTAARGWESWWSTNAARAGAPPISLEPSASGMLPSLHAPDARLTFTGLLHPRGGPVQLTNLTGLRGKKVLLNFWATWCSACLVELPTLRELQQRHPDGLVIVGVCLDRVDEADSGELRKRVAAFVGRQRLNYPVWLDPDSELGACFDGGELPTNVLLDAAGRVRRRFVGERSLSVWEVMLRELDAPAKAAP